MLYNPAVWRSVIIGAGEVVLFFAFLHRQKKERKWYQMLPCILAVSCVYIPLQMNIIHPLADILLRLTVGTAVVHFLYRLPFRRSLFLCLLFFLVIGVSKSLLSRPILLGFGFDLAAYTAGSELRQWGLSLATVLLETFTVWFVSRNIFVEKEEDTPAIQLLIAMLACATYMITRQVLRSYSALNASLGGWEITAAMFALCIASLLIVVFSEYYFISDKRKGQIQKLEQLLALQYASVKERQEADEAVRQMYHDIKNHLNCIRSISSNEQVGAYVDEIYQEISQHEQFFQTGNSVLDIVLHEKTMTARRKGIRLEVYTNFETMDFMEYVDICSIFSNALDNAIEAAEAMQSPADRWIRIKIQNVSGCLAVKIENPYEKELKRENGRLVTSKEDRDLHGLGLASIEHSIGKYGGEWQFRDQEGVFCLMLLIPVPRPDAQCE